MTLVQPSGPEKPGFKLKEDRGPSVAQLPPELEVNEIFSKDALSSATGRSINYDRIRTAAIWKTYMKDAGLKATSPSPNINSSYDAEREDKEAMELWMNNMDTLLVFVRIFRAETALILIRYRVGRLVFCDPHRIYCVILRGPEA